MESFPVPLPKRLFDILTSSLLIVLSAPLLALFLLAYVLEQIFVPSSRGSFFYTETRISQGRPFSLSKIRTLKISAIERARSEGIIHTKRLENEGTNFTSIGWLLHKLYLDETPQLLSVLRGDMSFVGPRPTNVENYENDVARGLQARRILRAGLTGRFQTHKHVKYKLNQEKTDLEYAQLCQNGSGLQILKHDLKVLLQTIITVLRAEGL